MAEANKLKYFRRWYSRSLGYRYSILHNEVIGMSTKTLKYLLTCDGYLTQTNCGWAEYEAWPIVKKIAEEELQCRAYKNRKRKKINHGKKS